MQVDRLDHLEFNWQIIVSTFVPFFHSYPGLQNTCAVESSPVSSLLNGLTNFWYFIANSFVGSPQSVAIHFKINLRILEIKS